MIKIGLVVLGLIIAAGGMLAPEKSLALFNEGGLTPISLVIYLIAAAIFSWIVVQIWNIASMIFKFAVIIAVAAFLGIAMITMFENKTATDGVTKTDSSEQAEAQNQQNPQTSENSITVAMNTAPKTDDAKKNNTEQQPKEAAKTDIEEEQEDLSFIQRFKRKFFITEEQVDKLKQKRLAEEKEAEAKKQREIEMAAKQPQAVQNTTAIKVTPKPHTPKPYTAQPQQPVFSNSLLLSSANKIKQAVKGSVIAQPTPQPTAPVVSPKYPNHTKPKAPAVKIVYDQKGTPIGKIDANGNYKHIDKKEAAAILKIVNAPENKQVAPKPQNQRVASVRTNVTPKPSRDLTPKQAAKIKQLPKNKEPAKPSENAYTPPADITPSSEVISGVGTAISGDTIELNGRWVTLFAIDAPHANQYCTKFTGESYACGMSAKRRLNLMLQKQKITCKALAKTKSGDYLAICSDGQNDIASVMVRTGWALAYRESSDIYVPYEEHAKNQGLGIWQGRFSKPWEYKGQ